MESNTSTRTMNENLEDFGDVRLPKLFASTRGMTIDRVRTGIKETIDGSCHVSGPQDDVTILTVKLIDSVDSTIGAN